VNASNLTSLPTSNPLTSEQIAKLAASANQLTREEIADLVKRGRELILAGKIRDARLLLKTAADAGDARAVFALGTTYDPAELEKLAVRDVGPDVAAPVLLKIISGRSCDVIRTELVW
jgi:ClpP class serine protease